MGYFVATLVVLFSVLPFLSSTSFVQAVWTPFADTSLNVSQIASSIPEMKQIYIGSPSITRVPNSNILLASHDTFGSGTTSPHTAFIVASADEGTTWQPTGSNVAPMYWATLFTRPNDNNVYLLGTSGDGSQKEPTQISLAVTSNAGQSWSLVLLTNSSVSFSTGPTPVIVHNNRLWRVFEHNTGPGWASGYSSVVLSIPVDASNLMEPSAWTLSGELPFSSVVSLVPTSWSNPLIKPGYGWLEGNAIVPVAANDTGINIILRVNSIPAANKAALLYLPNPTATPVFVNWIEFFPGGNSKFTIRKDETTGIYLTLSNNVVDDSITFPPVCGPMTAPTEAVPCCGFMESCYTTFPNCLWCHANNRNNLTFSMSTNLMNWTIVANILEDDTGVPSYISALGTGLQYVDWNFDTLTNHSENIYYAVRAGYRGSNNYHNSNRILFGWINNWKQYVT